MAKQTINELNKRIEELTLENNELKKENEVLNIKVKNLTEKENNKKSKRNKEVKNVRTAYTFFKMEEYKKHKDDHKENEKINNFLKFIKEYKIREKWENIVNNNKIEFDKYIQMEEDDKKRYVEEKNILKHKE